MMFIIKLKITQLFRFIVQWIKNLLAFIYQYIAHRVIKIVNSKPFIGILMLTIGITWTWSITYSRYEGAEILRFVRAEVSDFIQPRGKIVLVNNHVIDVALADEAVQVVSLDPVEKENYQIAVIKRISKEQKIDWKLVYAVCLQESGCNPKLDCEKQYGLCDSGLSFGAYQIYNPTLNPERKSMAENFEEATLWTIQHGYRFKDNPELFFKNHNGLYKKTNQWYVDGAMEKYKAL